MKRIGVVTAGDDAPGMNAAIRAIVRTSIFNGLEVVGIERGYAGLIERKIHSLDIRSVSGIINRGGTILKTARCEEIKTIQGARRLVKSVSVIEETSKSFLDKVEETESCAKKSLLLR